LVGNLFLSILFIRSKQNLSVGFNDRLLQLILGGERRRELGSDGISQRISTKPGLLSRVGINYLFT